MIWIMTKLLPIRDWIYAGLAVLAVLFWFWHDHQVAAAAVAHENAALQAQSEADITAAENWIDTLNKQHAADVAKVQGDYEKLIAANSASYAADLQRLRTLTAHSKTSTVLGSASAATSSPNGGACDISRVGSMAAKLADALRRDDAALVACRAERNLLTGKGGPQ